MPTATCLARALPPVLLAVLAIVLPADAQATPSLTWSTPAALPSPSTPSAVSCASEALCVAVDAQGNALLSDSIVEASTGNYVDAQGKLVALLGVKDLIVVDTSDALLIADRSRAQEVGELVRRLEKAGRHELL